jgi:hypothetical protein
LAANIYIVNFGFNLYNRYGFKDIATELHANLLKINELY